MKAALAATANDLQTDGAQVRLEALNQAVVMNHNKNKQPRANESVLVEPVQEFGFFSQDRKASLSNPVTMRRSP